MWSLCQSLTEARGGRKALPAPAMGKIAEVDDLVGELSDRAVAERAGVHANSVRAYRLEHGIPARQHLGFWPAGQSSVAMGVQLTSWRGVSRAWVGGEQAVSRPWIPSASHPSSQFAHQIPRATGA